MYATKITAQWTTIEERPYLACVRPDRPAERAHGGITLYQVRRHSDGRYLGRLVNSNRGSLEIGLPFVLDAAELDRLRHGAIAAV